ncbi:MAG: glycosyltransferase family 4 protein [Thermoguttaceae bacterium]|nr:glycosyltransferase family 4 protein [Thermoguttaceae bacterium]
MRIVVAHNYYGDYAVGGESVVFEQEVDYLRAAGCEVETLTHANIELARAGLSARLTAPLRFRSSSQIYEEATTLLRRFRPEILHVHNYKYVLTPSIFQAARDLGVRTVLTLHNYRLAAPCGQLRNGAQACERCVGNSALRSLWRQGCASSLRGRFLQTTFYYATRNLIVEKTDSFIALSEFGKSVFVRAGLPEERIFVKPNLAPDPVANGSSLSSSSGEPYAIFVGRLSKEKGAEFLADAWRDMETPLLVVGDGPLLSRLRANAPSNVVFLGARSRIETLDLLRNARLLVFPSLWYEGDPMAIVEASSLGVPILATRLGARAEDIAKYRSGDLFNVGAREDFITSARRILTNTEYRAELSLGARAMYEALNEPSKNIESALEIYRKTLEFESATDRGRAKCRS